MALRRLLDCPYCPRRRPRVIAVDPDAIAAMYPAGDNYPRLDAPCVQHAFSFNPDGHPNSPCPHLVSCYIDADVVMRIPGSEYRNHLALSGGWDHPWLMENDQDDQLNIYLWTEVGESVRDRFHPQSPYLRRRARPYYRRMGNRPAVRATGEFILALEPLRFLEELQRFYVGSAAE